MKELITAIQERLANNVSLKYVDENWGQLDYYSPNFPVKWPCALIDIAQSQFDNIGRDNNQVPANRQMGQLVIEIRVADMRLTNTSMKAPNMQKAYARSIFEQIEEIHALLHGWNPIEKSSKLIRTSQSRVKRDDGVQEYAIYYSCELNDC
jgi:hypothetical protein